MKKYVSFVGLCLGFFIVMMDTTTVPLLYTTFMKIFNVSPAMVAWINNIYLITYVAFLLLGGRLGDSANRKIVVLTAYLALGVGAAISGAGQTFTDVVVGRALMGAGAGLLTPQSMAYISLLFAQGSRGTVLGIWGAVAGIATATGPVITQVFLTTANWRWVMWINIPVALSCFLIAAWSLPNQSGRGIKIWDTAVSSLYGVCLAVAIVGLVMSATLFVIGTTAAAALIRNDLRKKRGYILSPELWRDRAFLRICCTSGLLGAGLTGFYLPLAFLLDIRMAFGPAAISAIMITVSLSCALVGPFAGNLSDRMEPERIVRLGLILFALANALLGCIGVLVPAGTIAFLALCAVMIVGGAGCGLAFAPLANLALGRARAANVGQAAAFFNFVRQALSAVGGVIVAIVFDSVVRLQLGRDLVVTATTLRVSANATAIAALTCFLLVAVSLSVAAYISRRERQPADYSKQDHKEILTT